MQIEFQDFLFNCQSRKLSPKTIKTYRNTIQKFINFAIESDVTNMDEINRSVVQSYIKKYIDAGNEDKYINNILRTLKLFFAYLEDEEYIRKNPSVKVRYVKEQSKIIETYTDDEAIRLIKSFNGADYLSIRNKTIIMLQIDTGIRCTETIDIQLKDLLNDRILIHGKGSKDRLVSISTEMYKQLKIYNKSRKIYFDDKEIPSNLFLSQNGRILTVEAIESVYKRAKVLAKITRAIRVSPHTSRHYYAVKMFKESDLLTVSRLLGHTNIIVTQNYLRSLTSSSLIDMGNIPSPLNALR